MQTVVHNVKTEMISLIYEGIAPQNASYLEFRKK